MAFTSPLVLLLLPLAAVPFLLTRVRQPRVRRLVANLYLWRPDAEAASPARAWRRPRVNASALLQAGAIAAIVLALAHPVWTFHPERAAFVFDLSASMGARDANGTRMEQARERALAALAQLSGGCRVRVVSARGVPVTDAELSAWDPELRRRIQNLAPTAGAGDLSPAIDAGRAFAGPAGLVFVVSDQPAPDSARDPGLRWMTVGQPADNRAIAVLAVRRVSAASPDRQLLTRVQNFGAQPVDTTLTLTIDGAVFASHELHLAAGASSTAVDDVRQAQGVVEARLSGTDALEVDDRRVLILTPDQPTRVRLWSDGSVLLRQALASVPGVMLDVRSPAESEAAGEVDVDVCEGCRELPAGTSGVLAIPPTDRGPRTATMLFVPDRTHPLAEDLDMAGVTGVPLSAPADATSDAPTVVVAAGATPVLVASERDGRRILRLNLDVQASALSLSPAFPILIANAIDWLAGVRERTGFLTAGQRLSWTLPPDASGLPIALTGPDRKPVSFQVSGRHVTSWSTDQPGVYRLAVAGTEHLIGVNPATGTESNLRAEAGRTSLPSALAEPSAGTRTQEWTWMLALGALALLALEWRVSGRQGAVK